MIPASHKWMDALNSAALVGLFAMAMFGFSLAIGAVALIAIPIALITELIASQTGRRP